MRGKNGEFLPLYLYPSELVHNPPTVAAGFLSVESEALNRAYACMMMARVGRMLTLPQSSISTGQVMLHRLYFRCSMHTHKLLPATMASLFVASKVEETPIKLRSLFNCFDRVLKRQAGLDPSPLTDNRFQAWSTSTKEMENIILHLLGYELYVDMPHKFILHFINYLNPTALISESTVTGAEEKAKWAEFSQYCWNTLNDCLLSARVLFQFHPEIVACASMYYSAYRIGLSLPSQWWTLFDVDTAKLESCVLEIAQLYQLLSKATSVSRTSSSTSSSSTTAASATIAPLSYIPTDADDNKNSNELCVYQPRNRQVLLAEKLKEREEAMRKSAPSGESGPSSSPVPSTASSVPASSPTSMQD